MDIVTVPLRDCAKFICSERMPQHNHTVLFGRHAGERGYLPEPSAENNGMIVVLVEIVAMGNLEEALRGLLVSLEVDNLLRLFSVR